jgi:hypothetical protein
MTPRFPAVLLATLLAAAAPAAAQYRVEGPDTLRYHEVTRGTARLHAPTGLVRIETLHDAEIALAFVAPGRATAWYEALTLEARSPGFGSRRPGTAVLLGRTFTLDVDPAGRVVTTGIPRIPETISAVADLTLQFDDFLISVPEGELTTGRRWADTLHHDQPGFVTDRYDAHRVRTFRVLGDTVFEGLAGKLIEVRVAQTLTVSSLLQPGATAAARISGTEEGIAIFAPAEGRLLLRTRAGSLRGRMTVADPAQPYSARYDWRYESRIEWDPEDDDAEPGSPPRVGGDPPLHRDGVAGDVADQGVARGAERLAGGAEA